MLVLNFVLEQENALILVGMGGPLQGIQRTHEGVIREEHIKVFLFIGRIILYMR